MRRRKTQFLLVFTVASVVLGADQRLTEQEGQPPPAAKGQSQKGDRDLDRFKPTSEQMPPGHAMSNMNRQQPGAKGSAMDHSQMQMEDMPNMPNMDGMKDMNSASMFLMGQSSGTAMNPLGWPMPAIMTHFGSWHAMFMGQAFIVDTQQSGPRGHDKFYSPNWFMGNFVHRAGSQGSFMTQVMISLDPATITDRQYPVLFQTGETAFNRKIVDGQHPHDLIMSLGFEYARTLGEDTTLQLYFAPVGDPALGSIAYPHRASAMELPQAALDHHLNDSTHIANEVITVGLKHKKVKVEASGFYGAEPNENRWNIDSGPIDSWSARIWYFPARNWAAQVSMGRIHNPERFEPGDQVRTTASLHYTKPLAGGSWASSLIWGRDHNTRNQHNTNSYLAESVVPIKRLHFITGRFELLDRDELFSNQPELEERLDRLYGSTFRIGAYTIGYTRDVELFRNVQTGIGANISAYSLPDAIKPYYGDRPFGVNMYVRFRLRQPQ